MFEIFSTRSRQDLFRTTFYMYVSLVTQSRPTLYGPMDYTVHQAPLWNFPGNNTGVECHFLLQEIFLTQ